MRAKPHARSIPAPEILIHQGIIDALKLAVAPNVRFFHCPNEGERAPEYAYRLKRMGVVAGVPDIIIIMPKGRVGFLEVKTDTGKLSIAQKEFRDDVINLGCPYAVVLSITDALQVLAEWGALKDGVRP